jgi:hypothetical protein
MRTDTIVVLDRGRPVCFSLEDLTRYHGFGSPGGVAHALRVMERAWPLLDPGAPPERRELTIATAFGGPGARDAFELVTRAVTEGRYVVDPALARHDLGPARERFVFRIGYRGRTVTLAVHEGFVTQELIDLARTDGRTRDEEARLDVLKREMAERVLGRPAHAVYDAQAEGGSPSGRPAS